jgi:hypothetical protein
LHGRSKKPSADILLAISKVIGCTIDDLLSSPTENTSALPAITKAPPPSTPSTNLSYNPDLYKKVVETANHLFQIKNLSPMSNEALQYISEIYNYTIKTGKNNIDSNFCDWLLEKTFHLSN